MTRAETVAQLQRKVERLEAQVEMLKQERDNAFAHYGKCLGDWGDLKTRVLQAVRILQAEEGER